MAKLYNCPTAVSAHALSPQFKTTLRQLSLKDYPRESYFGDTVIDCLDMDAVELSRSRQCSGPDSSVDAAIGVATAADDGSLRDGRLLLVELRMGYDTPSNIKASELLRKIDCSRSRLYSEDPLQPVDNNVVFVFRRDVEQRAVNVVSRLATEVSQAGLWHVKTPAGLCQAINYGQKPPYVVPQLLQNLAAGLVDVARKGDLALLESSLAAVKKQYDRSRLQYRDDDCSYLSAKIAEALALMDNFIESMSEDDRILLGLLKEEFMPGQRI